MQMILRITTSFLFLLVFLSEGGKYEGFYCDIFNDMGTGLSGPGTVPAIAYIGCSEEGIKIKDNKTLQSSIITKNENDDNGVLLYPDGEPRFACIYSHGGYMGHAVDVGEAGRTNIRNHYRNGGAHVGSCAGSYMLGSYFNDSKKDDWYCIWPGEVSNGPNAGGAKTDADIPAGSPLLNYGYDFGGDNLVKAITLNNGGCVVIGDPEEPVPTGTEILSLHKNCSKEPKLTGHGSSWGWKGHDTTGRVIGISPHPEGAKSGEIRDYMAANFLHAISGIAKPDIKHTLENGKSIAMNKSTSDNDPANTKIGDLQYHHFLLDLPNGGNAVKIKLAGSEGYDMHLFLAQDTFAFNNVDLVEGDSASGNTKTIEVPKLAKGKYYIGVKCATTVESKKTTSGSDSYYKYSTNLEVLNGVEYTIEAVWNNTDILQKPNQSIYNQFAINKIGKNYIIKVGKTNPQSIRIFNVKGRVIWEPKLVKNIEKYTWKPNGAGMYVVRMISNGDIVTRRITVVR